MRIPFLTRLMEIKEIQLWQERRRTALLELILKEIKKLSHYEKSKISLKELKGGLKK